MAPDNEPSRDASSTEQAPLDAPDTPTAETKSRPMTPPASPITSDTPSPSVTADEPIIQTDAASKEEEDKQKDDSQDEIHAEDEAEPDVKVEETQAKREPEPEPEPEAVSHPEEPPVAEPEPKAEREPEAEPESKAEAEPEPEPEAEQGDGPGAETPKIMTHDSMVTVRLSEPPDLTIDTSVSPDADHDSLRPDTHSPGDDASLADTDEETASSVTAGKGESEITTARASTVSFATPDANRTLQDELADDSSDNASIDLEEVNWEKLERKEGEQTKDDETDNSTTLLLQRLEQENAKLATNPKTVKVHVADEATAASSAAAKTASKPRPPSMAQLRQMVNGPPEPNLRYSMLPPPPMTDLEFWGALVKDYQQTAARLPTLLANKIHKGIPPPLRGVVWQSMSGARDGALEEQYDRLCGESSPYEMLIGKDLGRSFPGVEMFREPEGDGQRMLGRVLKAFSLYDTKIGYCQGLAFLVGPLLMHMPDKQAFCVLVRLMERYDLRACFLPDLSGLHVRIFQFRELLKNNLTALSNHFDKLQVDPAYVSQWFLSFFAVTCPLPMLFRIYDVIFAEGASETLMRVALSLMRKNESRLLACTELEDVMQLLLSRGLWDCYHYDADEFVEDFVSLTSEVSLENLSQLERGYRDSLVAASSTTRTSEITKAATRFLGRIWASSMVAPKTNTLSPGGTTVVPPRSLSMLRRSTSKQSLASTLNSMEASSASVASSASTEASTVSRDSSNTEDESMSRESTPVGSKVMTSTRTMDERHLHTQIEDLLTAMGELQRNQAVLTNQLQREREEREEDHKAVRPLLDMLKRRQDLELDSSPPSPPQEEVSDADAATHDADSDSTRDTSPLSLAQLVEKADERFELGEKKRRSSMLYSKVQLRDELAQVKDQLASSMSLSQDFNRKVHELDAEAASLRDQLRESHAHVRNLNQDKNRLEKQLQAARANASGARSKSGTREMEAGGFKPTNGGLREFKLARSKSTPSQAGGFGHRLSSIPPRRESAVSVTSVGTGPMTPTTPTGELTVPSAFPNDDDTLLLELAQSKTAEAIAKQEAEEAKQKLESLRKACGLAAGDTPPASASSETTAVTAMGIFGRRTASSTTTPESAAKAAMSTSSGSSTSGGGFWGWRR